MDFSYDNRPILTLAEIEAFDPRGVGNRRWCPLCGANKPKDGAHRSLSLDKASGRWKCFRCGAGGVVREKWRETGTTDPREIRGNLRRQRLLSSFSIAPSVSEAALMSDDTVIASQRSVPPEWQHHWDKCVALAGTTGEKYLGCRGLPLQVAKSGDVRFGPDWPSGASVVFPILDRREKLVAVQGRAVQGSAKRTYGPKKEGMFRAAVRLPSGRLLGPLDPMQEWVLLTEAPLDALSLATAGYPAVALCGTSGPSWLHLACGLKRVFLALDADEAGEVASQALEIHLAPYGARCERLCPVGAKDWNEMLVGQGREGLSDWLAARVL